MKLIRSADIPFTPASHEDPTDPGVYKKVLFSRGDFPEGKVQMVNWAYLPVGKGFRNHFHETLTEIFVVVRGSISGTVNNTAIELGEGDAMLVEPGERHTFANTADHETFYVVFGITGNPGGKTVVVSGPSVSL